MIKIKNKISLDEKEVKFEFIRSSGPGGQNVNKVSTAVQLRFNIIKSKSINNDIKSLLVQKLKNKMNNEGEVIITARRFRTQEKNRVDAIDRLIKLLSTALEKKKKRIPTKATKSSQEERLKRKKKRSEIKKRRGGKISPENY